MHHGCRVNTPFSSPRFTAELIGEELTVVHEGVHAYMHSKTQPGMHKPQASIFHYYNAISWRQGWAVLHCSCTRAECARWAVIDTRAQTRDVAKKYRRDPAVSSVLSYTSYAGTQLCPLQTHIATHSLKHIQDCLWQRLCFI